MHISQSVIDSLWQSDVCGSHIEAGCDVSALHGPLFFFRFTPCMIPKRQFLPDACLEFLLHLCLSLSTLRSESLGQFISLSISLFRYLGFIRRPSVLHDWLLINEYFHLYHPTRHPSFAFFLIDDLCPVCLSFRRFLSIGAISDPI